MNHVSPSSPRSPSSQKKKRKKKSSSNRGQRLRGSSAVAPRDSASLMEERQTGCKPCCLHCWQMTSRKTHWGDYLALCCEEVPPVGTLALAAFPSTQIHHSQNLVIKTPQTWNNLLDIVKGFDALKRFFIRSI